MTLPDKSAGSSLAQKRRTPSSAPNSLPWTPPNTRSCGGLPRVFDGYAPRPYASRGGAPWSPVKETSVSLPNSLCGGEGGERMRYVRVWRVVALAIGLALLWIGQGGPTQAQGSKTLGLA